MGIDFKIKAFDESTGTYSDESCQSFFNDPLDIYPTYFLRNDNEAYEQFFFIELGRLYDHRVLNYWLPSQIKLIRDYIANCQLEVDLWNKKTGEFIYDKDEIESQFKPNKKLLEYFDILVKHKLGIYVY